MPMTRYEIRNEYSLADPELYRAADKDDPEALLEGVAMAGLVGVLRQLGDLAEFAAEIFHNLHEDMMATASRGHALAFRVQQLEIEIPAVERAFLSQTDHSSFFYHPGVDWHPNLRLDNNLVTREDMPRFIMDSYEECREPPRLFLLDKFDIAGAGACLKRYTDPSFFKVESSEVTSADIQREKKIRKVKKKGPRWRNRETHEVVPTSHAKLHQLFLEERVENGINSASLGAKLKRRLNGFPFNSKTGKSYMEKILKSPSPDHKVLHNTTVDSPQLKLASNHHHGGSGSEIFEVRPLSPYRERGARKRSTPSSPDREGVVQNPPTYDSDEFPIDDETCELPSSHASIATNGLSSSLDNVTGEKVVAVDAESNRAGGLTGYESEDMASEKDNFVDAPSTMESEMDRDSNLRIKRDGTSPIQMESLSTDTYEEPPHSRSSDSQSIGDSMMSDVGNNSSDSPSVSAEKPQSESSSTKGSLCTDICVNEIVGASSYHETADEDFPVVSNDTSRETDVFINRRSGSKQVSSSSDEFVRKYMLNPPEPEMSTLDDKEEKTDLSIDPSCVPSNGRRTETNTITNQRSEFEQVTSTLCMNGSMPTVELSDPEDVVGDHKPEAPGGSDEMVFVTDDIEKMINLITNPPFSPRACISGLQSEDDLSRSSEGEQIVDGPNGENVPCLSTECDIYHHNTDSSVKTSSNLLHEDEYDGEDRELADDASSTLNTPNVLSTNGILDTMSSGNAIQDNFEDEFPEVPNSADDYPDAAHNGDNIEPKGDDLIGVWDDGDSNVSTDSLNHFPCFMEASLQKGLEETPLAGANTLTVDNNSTSSIDNETSLDNLKLSHLANSPDSPMGVLDAHDDDIPEEDTTVDDTLPLGTPEPCEAESSQGTEIPYHVSPNDSEALEISHLEEPSGTSDAAVEMDGVSLFSGSNAQEVTEITNSADIKPTNEIHVLLSESDSEADTSNTTEIITFPVPAISDDASLSKLVEEHNGPFDDSGVHELENEKNSSTEGESDHVEKLGSTEASASGSGSIVCNSVDNDNPESELSGWVPNSHLNTEQCDLDREQELFNESGLENHVVDAPSLPADIYTEESVQDKVGLPPSLLDQHLPCPGEISPELSPSSPMNYLQTLDNEDGKGESTSVSAFSLANGSGPPPIPELSRSSNNEFNVPGYPKDPLGSISAPNNPFLEANQINLSDLPPLPPLPPVQWRMGKLQHALPSAEEEMIRNEESFPQLLSPTAATDDVGSTPSAKPTHDGSSPPTAPTDGSISVCEVRRDSVTELAVDDAISKDKNLENSCSSSEAKTLLETTDHPEKIENIPQLLATPIPESVSASSAAEDSAENGSQKVKFPRPHNPLVDDVSFLDKSKLRKVTERVMPEIQKVEERDSLLQQIRTKSFNLKPAMASRPSIRTRAPNTNLKVVAILEKANAIRQAFAGSDEDDDDSWSE
ncbi:SCAR-like protein 1 [Salvia miltiorrhiza]|uniref:SCAR-like protein 1 n=1 Tax=Salvia miltiorrhiza TaxID=226208 RepID=UPI0025AD1FDE|nr:SCAR-like protein 1 [Salvia miltiorrhiza]